MNEDYRNHQTLIRAAIEYKQITETDYQELVQMFNESDGECLEELLRMNSVLQYKLKQHQISQIVIRLEKADPLIEQEKDAAKKRKYVSAYEILCAEIAVLSQEQEELKWTS